MPVEKSFSSPRKSSSRKFHFYSDPAHGWLRVPIQLLHKLGIENRISAYSYKRGKFAYLEEDADATAFLNAYEPRYGKVDTISHDSNKSSRIRSYEHYKSFD